MHNNPVQFGVHVVSGNQVFCMAMVDITSLSPVLICHGSCFSVHNSFNGALDWWPAGAAVLLLIRMPWAGWVGGGEACTSLATTLVIHSISC